MAGKKNVLAVCVYVDGKPYGPGEVSARIAKKIDNPKVWAQDEDEAQAPAPPAAPPADEALSVYAGVDVEDLKAEVEHRNADRDDDKKIVVAKDADEDALVAALDADDAAQAES